MDLWIRSQDKEKLLKANDIAIEMNMIYGYFDKNTEYEHLGSYATKERALEVLDEIHQRLINLQCIEITGADFITQQMKKNGIDCVYEMPKE